MLLCYSCIYAFAHIKSNHICAFIFRYRQVFKFQNLSQVIYIHLYLDIERFLKSQNYGSHGDNGAHMSLGWWRVV